MEERHTSATLPDRSGPHLCGRRLRGGRAASWLAILCPDSFVGGYFLCGSIMI